jgi:hypothetical protein
MKQHCGAVWTSLLMVGSVTSAHAQSIYTCVDATGRKITSDRPIATCMDRDQRELNPSGTTKRIIKPTMTADEQRVHDAKLKAEAAERLRIDEEKRRDRALLSRYPHRQAHDKERSQALAQVDSVIATANRRITELADQRKKLDLEMEFYKKDPTKAPARLKRLYDENDKAVAAQKRFIGEQEQEKQRVNGRFEEELGRLKVLWGVAGPATAASAVKP